MKKDVIIRLDEKVLEKVTVLAEKESRSRKKMLELLIERNCNV